jgi:hypothetical protein
VSSMAHCVLYPASSEIYEYSITFVRIQKAPAKYLVYINIAFLSAQQTFVRDYIGIDLYLAICIVGARRKSCRYTRKIFIKMVRFDNN